MQHDEELDEEAADLTERLARLLDDGFEVPGTSLRFGLDPLLGLIPGLGDFLASAGSLFIVVVAARRGVPLVVLLRMLLNLTLDALLGSVPLVGDVFDFAFHANRRNRVLLKDHEVGEVQPALSHYVVLGAAVLVTMLGAALPWLLLWALLRH